MKFLRLSATAGPDGLVRFEFPAEPGRVYEVAVAVAEEENGDGVYRTPTPEEVGHPPGYIESVVGSVTDPAFEAPPRRPVKPIAPLDADE